MADDRSLALGGGKTYVDSTWIPSHLDPQLCSSPFEEWIADGNNTVGGMAVRANQARSEDFQELKRRQTNWDALQVQALTKLRSYYLEIFERTKNDRRNVVAMTVADSDEDTEGALYSLSDVFFSAMDADSFVQSTGFPFAFWLSLLGWVRRHESDHAPSVPLKVDPISFPFTDAVSGCWEMRDRFTLFHRPTFSYFLGIVQKVFRYVCASWTSRNPFAQNLDRSCTGVATPVQGILMQLDPICLGRIRDSVALLTRRRMIRRACDLSRPVASETIGRFLLHCHAAVRRGRWECVRAIDLFFFLLVC